MNTAILTVEERRIRQNIRNFLMVATTEELAKELAISLERGDKFRAECVRELMGQN